MPISGAQVNRTGAYTKRILRGLLILGALYFALSSPSGARKLYRAIGKEYKKYSDRYYLRKQLLRLRDKKLIHYSESNGYIQIELTEEGRREALIYNPETMTLPKSHRWDGKWRMIAFDIPESKRRGRDALRHMMQELGAIQLQKSLWVWPYECRQEIDFIAELFTVGKYVHYFVAESTTANPHLKARFHLP